MAVKNDWIYFILTKLLAMVFVAGILWERYRCFFEKTVIRLVDISHILLSLKHWKQHRRLLPAFRLCCDLLSF